jgi:hypothetical protein
MDLYNQGAVPFWDLFESAPQGSWMVNPTKLSLNLSGIQLKLAFSF